MVKYYIENIWIDEGGNKEGKGVSEYLEESPFRLARPVQTKSCDVLWVERPQRKGVGVRPGARHEQKLASLWRIL